MEIGARNQIRGLVTGVHIGDIMGEVEVAIDQAAIIAAITTSSIKGLGVKNGDRVTVIIKSTEVLIRK